MFAPDYFAEDYYSADYFPPGSGIVLAAAILQAGAADPTLSDEELLKQQIEWDDREVIELLQIVMQSGILK